jgi:hypothetical protein
MVSLYRGWSRGFNSRGLRLGRFDYGRHLGRTSVHLPAVQISFASRWDVDRISSHHAARHRAPALSGVRSKGVCKCQPELKMKTPKFINGYHFTGDTLRNGEPIPAVGEWLVYSGKIAPCKSGLHASVHPFDALRYAPGNLLHRVTLEGELTPHGVPVDKWVGRRRLIHQTINAEKMLRDFARWNARQVLHLWAAPDCVVKFLKGDDSLRAAAYVAARDAASDAASAAARDAAYAAARAAASAAARDAAYAAASAAARDAAYAAARAAASAAARAAAYVAARDAASDAYAADVYDAAQSAARVEFLRRVRKEFANVTR